MKKRSLIPLILLFCQVAQGQSTRNARRLHSGTAVPTMSCSPGPSYTDFYLRTTTDVLYYCSAANTWSVFSTAGGGATAWGTITGTLSAQTDLQSALDAKASLASPGFSGTPNGPSWRNTGTAGLGFTEFLSQSSNPSAPASGYREYADSTGRRAWIRASDGFTRTWDATLTANRVYTLQNRSGTIADDTDLALKANLISPSFTTPTLGVASATSLFTSGTIGASGTITANAALVSGSTLEMRYSAGTGHSGGGMDSGGTAFRNSINKADVGTIQIASGGQFSFGSTTGNQRTEAADTGVGRNAAGVVEFNSGAAGTLRDWTARAGTLSSATVPITFSNAAYQSCTGFTSTAGGVLTCTASTAKVKQGFQFFRNGLDAIRRIQPQTFSYRSGTPYFDGGKKHLGLVAENLQQANPLLASASGTGVLQPEPLAIAAIQIAALKELDARVSALEKENKRLRRILRRRR